VKVNRIRRQEGGKVEYVKGQTQVVWDHTLDCYQERFTSRGHSQQGKKKGGVSWNGVHEGSNSQRIDILCGIVSPM
jgi:hypothetical protein